MAGPEASQQATIEWRRLAADKNVAIDVARGLWEQAKAVGGDPVARSNLFRRLLDEAAKNPSAAQEPGKSTLVDSKGPADPTSLGPGKTTLALLDAQKPGAPAKPSVAANEPAPTQAKDSAAAKDAAGAAPGADANRKDESPTAPPTVDKLRSDLVAAAQASQDVAALLATVDSATIVEVLKQLRAGSPTLLQKVLTAAGAAIERIIGQQLPDPTQAKADGPPGIRVPFLGGEGEVHTQFMSDEGVPMVSTPMPVAQKVAEWRADIQKRHPADQESFAPTVARASGLNTSASDQAKKAKLGDEPAKAGLPDTQKQLAATLGTISRELAAKPTQPPTPAASPAAAPMANASAASPTAAPASAAASQQPSGAPAPDAQQGAATQSGAQQAAPQQVGAQQTAAAPQAGAQPGPLQPGAAPAAVDAQAAADPAAAPKPTDANAKKPDEAKKPEDEAKNPDAPKKPEVPRSLVATHINAKASNPALERAIFGLKGSQDFGKGGDPAQVTKTLLAAHPEASMADTGALTLPAANAAAIGAATTLEGVASVIMAATGVSKVRLSNPDGQSLEITIGINPEIQLGKLEPMGTPLKKADLQRMAAAARAVIAQNDAALKAQMLNSPTKIKRVVVGAGYAAVATYVTLPESERQHTIGVGFADPWALRAELLMGQTAEYLQVAGFPSFADIDHVNKGGYLPSNVFADTTALARAQAGMAVFPGWAGQSEHFDPAVHAVGATDVAKDLNLKQETKKPDDADIEAQVQANAAQDEVAKQEKKIKPIATADEHMNQKGVAKGRTLIVGAGAAAAWNAQKAKDASGDYAWIGRPAPAVPGITPSQPRGQMLLRESFLAATGGGNRNDGVLDWSKMFLGEVSKIEITKPTDASAMEKPKFDTPGANAEPPKRTAEQKKEPWQTSAEYKVRVPINMDGTSVLVYAQNLDLSSGPGPARKLNVGAPGQNPGDAMDPARGRGPVQLTQEHAVKGDKLALPEEIEVDAAASPGNREGRDDGQLPAPPSGKFGQVVLSIGQDANAPGGINDLIKNNGITTTIIWDRPMADPKNEWDGRLTGLPPASPLGVENKAMGIRVLGAAATEGPGLLPDDAVVYKLAQNAHLGRLGDAGGRAEGGVSRLAGTFQSANSQLDGGSGTPLPNAGENNADVPTGADKGKEKKPGQLDPNFVPAARENDAQKAAAFARRMEGYAAQGLTSGEDAARVKQQAEAVGGHQQGAQQATSPQQSASRQQPASSQQPAPQQPAHHQNQQPELHAPPHQQPAAQQANSQQPAPQDAAQPTVQPAVQQPTPPPPDEVTMTPAEPIVETTTMAGAPHVLRADPTRGNIDFHSIAGFAVPKLQSVVDLVPESIRQKVSLALAKAVEATALVADPSLKIGAKPADRPPILQRLGAKLTDLAVAIRLFGDSGNLTDADPTTVERANQQKAEKKKRDEEAAAIAKKATQDAKNPELDLGPVPAPPDAAPASALAPLPNGPLQPMPPKKETEGAEKPGVSSDGPLFSPSERDADKGFKQANDARTDDQTAEGPKTAQGALAKKEHGGKEGESVADAATRLHGDITRDSHFNPLDKVNFERALAGALLANAANWSGAVNVVSARIKQYLERRKIEALKEGLENAQQMYQADLAGLTKASGPGWWGAVAVQNTDSPERLGDMTLHTLDKGSLPQKLAVHQAMYPVLANDFQQRKEITRRILGVAAKEPWYIRQQTKLKNGAFDSQAGSAVFKPHDLDKNDPAQKAAADAAETERGRVLRPDTSSLSPAAPGIQARDAHGTAPQSLLPPGEDTQLVTRGIDSFTMDEARDFCQRARLVVNMPLAAGVSGSTAELIGVANTLGLSIADQKKYAVSMIAYIAGGGNHSYHEIAVVLAAARLIGSPDDYSGVKELVGADLFDTLKNAHPGAFKDEKPDPPKPV